MNRPYQHLETEDLLQELAARGVVKVAEMRYALDRFALQHRDPGAYYDRELTSYAREMGSFLRARGSIAVERKSFPAEGEDRVTLSLGIIDPRLLQHCVVQMNEPTTETVTLVRDEPKGPLS